MVHYMARQIWHGEEGSRETGKASVTIIILSLTRHKCTVQLTNKGQHVIETSDITLLLSTKCGIYKFHHPKIMRIYLVVPSEQVT